MIFENKQLKGDAEPFVEFLGEKPCKSAQFQISENVSFTDHVIIKCILIKAEKAAFLCWKCIGRFISVKTSLQLNFFNTLVPPIMLYCSSDIWFPFILKTDEDLIEI